MMKGGAAELHLAVASAFQRPQAPTGVAFKHGITHAV
jgi:hypothetical protein